MHNAFYQGQYQAVIDFDTTSFSSENVLPARILQLRAQIATGAAEEVLAKLKGDGKVPDLAAVKALAQYATGNTTLAIGEVEKLASTYSENVTVQILGGTVLQAGGKSDEALGLLTKHQGSLEAYDLFLIVGSEQKAYSTFYRVALIVQIHLQQNRTDLALKEVQAARKWAQDSLLVNIAESWVGLRMVSGEYRSQVPILLDATEHCLEL